MGGLLIRQDSLRYYPEGDSVGHVIGYTGKMNRKEYKENYHKGWLINDSIGRSGVEKTFNEALMGTPGGQQIEVDARGHQLRTLGEKAPILGDDLFLTIDIDLQKKILGLLYEDKPTVVCIVDINTQEILSYISLPSYDPNIFLDGKRSEERVELLTDKTRPLVDRVNNVAYSPGSVFKLLVAIAALHEGKVTEDKRFMCRGSYQINSKSRAFKCWYEKGHGSLNLVQAIEQSCNVYFYRLGLEVGNQTIAKYAKEVGLGTLIESGLPYGRRGLVPDASWKKRVFGERWYAGETMNYAIGQGFIQVTPLQVAKMISIIASEGQAANPRVVQKQTLSKKPTLKKEYLQRVKYYMLRAIESTVGTGRAARPSFLKTAGKTGTAQTSGGEPHSWFAGFFPYHNPEIALVVFVENGGPGGGIAAEYASEIADTWLIHRNQTNRLMPQEI